VSRRPGLLGASVFSLDDILRVLHPFLRRFRAAQAADPDITPFIISADVQKAFDSGEHTPVLALRAVTGPGFSMSLRHWIGLGVALLGTCVDLSQLAQGTRWHNVLQ